MFREYHLTASSVGLRDQLLAVAGHGLTMIPCPHICFACCGRFPRVGTDHFPNIPHGLPWMRVRHLASTTTRTVQRRRPWRRGQVACIFCVPDSSSLNLERLFWTAVEYMLGVTCYAPLAVCLNRHLAACC